MFLSITFISCSAISDEMTASAGRSVRRAKSVATISSSTSTGTESCLSVVVLINGTAIVAPANGSRL